MRVFRCVLVLLALHSRPSGVSASCTAPALGPDNDGDCVCPSPLTCTGTSCAGTSFWDPKQCSNCKCAGSSTGTPGSDSTCGGLPAIGPDRDGDCLCLSGFCKGSACSTHQYWNPLQCRDCTCLSSETLACSVSPSLFHATCGLDVTLYCVCIYCTCVLGPGRLPFVLGDCSGTQGLTYVPDSCDASSIKIEQGSSAYAQYPGWCICSGGHCAPNGGKCGAGNGKACGLFDCVHFSIDCILCARFSVV